jgi:hypothetical protein
VRDDDDGITAAGSNGFALPAIPQARGSAYELQVQPVRSPGILTASWGSSRQTLCSGALCPASPTTRCWSACRWQRPIPTARELRALREELARASRIRIDLAVQIARRLHRTWPESRAIRVLPATRRPRWRSGGQRRSACRSAAVPGDAAPAHTTISTPLSPDLTDLIQRNPRGAQARLTRATILQVQGKLRLRRRPTARRCAASHPRSSGRRAPTGSAASTADCARATRR